jgi:putative ABC transport system permease protein
LLNDLRQAIRALWHHPGFSAVAVITLALGIGANTALFSIADAVLLRPLPYPEPERLVWIDGAPFRFTKSGMGLSRRVEQSVVLNGAGIYAPGALNVGGDPGAERVRAAAVTPGFLTALNAAPVSGRVFTETDVTADPRVAVIGHALWKRRGGKIEPGDSLLLNGRAFTVLGVLPPRVDFPAKAEVWVPVGSDHQITGRAFAPSTIARLARGITSDHARAEIDRINHEGAAGRYDPGEVRVLPLMDELVGSVRPLFLIVGAAVLLVLLVACINTANLLLARMSAREREMSVRRALGASRFRLVRHLLCESAVLSTAAGLLALPVALWTLDALRVLLPPTLHGVTEIAIDRRAIAATAALCAIATVVFGVAPAWTLRRASEGSVLRTATSGTTDPFWRRFRSGLVAAELAIAVVLTAGAAAIVNTVATLMRADIGVRGDGALTMETTLPMAKYDSAARLLSFHERVQTAVRALPGVEAVGATSLLPGSKEIGIGAGIEIENLPVPEGKPSASYLSVTPDYFRALGIDLLVGRPFSAADRPDGELVAVVSERVARTVGLTPQEAIGRRIKVAFRRKPTSATIVGVSRDVAMRGPDREAGAQVYMPLAQEPAYGTTFLVVKSAIAPSTLATAVRAAVASVDSDLPLYNVQTFAEIRSAFVADRRFAMTVISAFGLLATVLAGIGLYGVLTYLVQLRTREIGIRMALGASPAAVRWQMMRTGLLHAIAGAAIGAGASVVISRIVVSRVPGIQPAGMLLTIAAVGAVLAVAAVVTWMPARRATLIDPVHALRSDG